MKKIKKNIIYLLLFFICIFIASDEVQAKKYETWNYYFSPYVFPNAYGEMEYCVYTRNNVYEFTASQTYMDVESENGNLYNGNQFDDDYRKFAFIYNRDANEILFVAGYQNIQRTIDNPSGSAVGTYQWNSKPKQKIKFMTNLSNYMIVDGKLECNPLVFVQDAGDLKIYRGDKHLYGEWTLGSNYYDYKDENVVTLNQIYKSAEESGLYYYYNTYNFLNKITTYGKHEYGVNTVKICNEKLEALKMVEAYYENNIVSKYERLAGLAKEIRSQDTYFDWKVTLFYKEILSLEEHATILQEKITDLEIKNVPKGVGFNINNCENINDAPALYTKVTDGPSGILYKLKSQFYHIEKATEKWGSDKSKQDAQTAREVFEVIRVDWEKYLNKVRLGEINKNATCEGLLGPDLLDDISTVLLWIRIAVPILVIILGSVDFVKATLSEEQQQLKKSTSTFIKRCIIAVAIFFTPTIIMFILSYIDKIADVSCDIRLW